MSLNVSIVIYKTPVAELDRLLESIFKESSIIIKVYIVDNYSNNGLEYSKYKNERKIEYISTGRNLGYGTAHNIAILKSIASKASYHLVVNPDIYFNHGTINELVRFMKFNEDVGLVMPKVFYPNGKFQYLCKLLPNPMQLLIRRFFPFKEIKYRFDRLYELRDLSFEEILNVPSLSGCFMFMRCSVLIETGIFDEKYFMYMEDVDLCRRIGEKYKTIYYPTCSIIHEYKKASYGNLRLMMAHAQSAIYYFNKWGWFFDKKRREVNSAFLERHNLKK